MLITYKKLLEVAKENNFAIAAPDVWSIDSIEGAYESARELNAPVVLMVWDAGQEWIRKVGNVVKLLEKEYPDVVASLLLDHGASYESEVAAIKAGFTGVMSDRSKLPFEDNISSVCETVKVAHAVNVSVEAELGHVGQGFEYEATRDATLTKPEEALEFVKRTNVDALAVAVGTSHGIYKGTPYLDFDRLDEIKKIVDVPLVLHGGSGTGDENLAKAVEHGINKVNLCSDLFTADLKASKEFRDNCDPNNLDEYYLGGMQASKDGFKEELKHYMRLFKSDGKADLYKEYRSDLEEHYYEQNNTVCSDK